MSRKENLEAFIDAMRDSLETIKHNSAEMNYVCDRILKLQTKYKRLYGNYYTPKDLNITTPTVVYGKHRYTG